MSELYGNLLHQLAIKFWKQNCTPVSWDTDTPRKAGIYCFKDGYKAGYEQAKKDFENKQRTKHEIISGHDQHSDRRTPKQR